MFDLVMFDLDGTLVDTADEIVATANDVLLELGLPPAEPALVRTWIGQGSRELMIRAYANASGTAADEMRRGDAGDCLMPLFAHFHEQHCGRHSRVYPKVRETLDALAACGLGLAILSNREARFAHAVLEAHGLRDYFDPVIAGDSLRVKKPDPQTVRWCLELHGVARERTLLVGDSAIDVATARNAGIAGWMVPYGYNGGVPIATAKPERVIADLGVLADLCRPMATAKGILSSSIRNPDFT